MISDTDAYLHSFDIGTREAWEDLAPTKTPEHL